MSNAWRLSRVVLFSLISIRSVARRLLRFVMPVSAFVIRHSSFVILSFLLLASRPLQVFGADHLKEIQKRGVLLWGADAEGGAPYVYPDPQRPERLVGFEVDLADALAAKLGAKAKLVQNQWDQLIPALERGNFDIILNGLEITPEVRRQIAVEAERIERRWQKLVKTKERAAPCALADAHRDRMLMPV